MSDAVEVLSVFDDGAGPALFTGGTFTSAFDSGDSFLARSGCPLDAPRVQERGL